MSLTNNYTPNILSSDHVVKRAKEGASGTRGDRGSPHFFLASRLMPQEKPVTVEIFRQTYQLGTSEGRDAEHVRRAASYLDDKMNEAAAAVGNRAPLDIAILAALNIAEEVLTARQQKDQMLDQADAQIDSFTQMLTKPNDKNDAEEDPPSGSKRF